jgi:hypothetical protein
VKRQTLGKKIIDDDGASKPLAIDLSSPESLGGGIITWDRAGGGLFGVEIVLK